MAPAMATIIRAADPSDAAAIADIYGYYVRETAISFEVVPPTADEMRERIDAITARYPWLVCADGADVLGYAYLGRHHERAAYRWAIDASVYVRREAHRRGIGRALYAALLPIGVEQNFYNAYAGITLPNAASVGLHEAMGFRPIGRYRAVGYKLGKWHDVGYWELSLRSRSEQPAEPRAIAAVRDTPAWREAIAAGERLLRR
jgi:phosphinothricin acetyltransferase